ncbi:alpha/beta hydrolase family esterase [Desulfoluna butyratoxydans]|uniref:Alpha/beta hydrolase fold n=1 Tax=Desulfoluna butyratoxydans TaxID=231438 RepID=A0A4U8YHH4_9BACT|nr:PHB depolymerase family esterase [Desulfoluna butyratoxydans]VFQ43015.1 alpha/beta hydrolase fold [Desulfoluna butyratoxydans]
MPLKPLLACLLLISVLLMAGCDDEYTEDPGGSLGPGNWKLTLSYEGKTRPVYLHVPSGYRAAAPLPLLLSFHGHRDTPAGQAEKDGFPHLADREPFIVAYPKGSGTPGLLGWNAGPACCGQAENNNVDDVGFTRHLVAHLQTRCAIDADRIYAHGHANGGGMAHRLGREAPDLFAAVSVSSMPVLVPDITPDYPIPVIHFHGTSDNTIAYAGGTIPLEDAPYMGAEESFADWCNKNGCAEGAAELHFHGASWCTTTSACDDGVTVTLCTLKGGGHNALYEHGDISVSQMSWDFMTGSTP